MQVNISLGLDLETATRVQEEAAKQKITVAKYVREVIQRHVDALDGAIAKRDLTKQHAEEARRC